MNDPLPSPRRTKSGIRYSHLGHFRVQCVGECPAIERKIDSPESVLAAWHDQVATSPWFDPEKEHMIVFVLNTRYQLKGWNVVSVGSVNESISHPREILRPVLVAAGFAFVIAHNHPSGDPSPSDSDRVVTRRVLEASNLLMVRMLDHVVVGSPGRHFSFKEAGLV
jgi:DNA repair protein RadC